MRLLCSFLLAGILVLTATACSDPVAPTPDLVAGSYMATAFQAEGNDVLAAGGSLTLVLTP